MKSWEIFVEDLSKAGWSWGGVSAVDCEGRTVWIVDAHRGDGKRFAVHADEKLTAFLDLGAAIKKPATRSSMLPLGTKQNPGVASGRGPADASDQVESQCNCYTKAHRLNI